MPERCAEERLLSAWLDDELDGPERAGVAAHLDECSACAAELEGLRVVRSQLRSLPERRVPAGVFDDAIAVGQRARTGVAVLTAMGVLLIATVAATEGGDDQLPRTVDDVPVEAFVADHVTHTSQGAWLAPAEPGPRAAD